MKRKLVIGDIHGAYKALLQILERASVNENDTLIFVGDYVDGWSQSFEVISYLIELQQKNDCIFIRGNHDTWCEQWLERGFADEVWVFHGGQATINSYQNKSEPIKKQHLEFFQRLKDFLIDDQNRLFIHAGFASMHGPEKEPHSTNFTWDRTLWETAVATDPQILVTSALFPKRLKRFNEIYIGHTPTIHIGTFEPAKAVNVWNVDTGAAFNGKLSILDVDTKQFWQSDVVAELYPDETGRNTD
ncbi:MAG: metallophosphoesterase family protein [Ferruginibacter sp.]